MNKHSILLRIVLSFFLAIVATTALFKVMHKHEFTNEREKLRVHYHHVAMSVMRWKIGESTYDELLVALKKDNISVVEDKKLYKSIQNLKKFDTVSCAKGDFHLYERDSFRYVIVPPEVGTMLLKDENTRSINVDYVWWLYAAFIAIMLLLLLSIAISLYPLKHLQLQIRRFGEGEVDIDFSSTRSDEIAEVSNEFNKSAKKIREILQARIIFLRNITHECKTPITSGKLALEFIEDSKSKNVLNNVFTRLELLLKEFVHIEKITATDQKLQKKLYPLTDVIGQATDMLFLEPDSIKNNFSKRRLEINFELFTIVFKNLIDNGLKYSQDNDFYIECEEHGIHFCSRGDKMDEELDYYVQPFTKGEMKASESFGLGLYIVDAILRKHNYTLSYKYENGYNCFTIEI
ncbi:two-component sensor histidine kinase [Sulfurimonas gotlandica GD1]|jgi:two-component system OmpR family sensor kinase|uniref:histidine kinase n=1 Tax=Sulfurimonas gotlandica (strain DSM 19862 / JCM 16533 / GD1) TaxID=929558 RepID=B6BN61_SULGG|nr:ArsS family sensor histidine kinase [Sulfurimonas gotlandica]EDZ61419.1 sensor histidine kinase [Sulfurimonas gotlandica GD1]EHP30929.1 two-component sensor histidine kinase [Sulfurimonas gotlandica GD1]